MVASRDTVARVIEVLERELSPIMLERVATRLLDVPGNQSFRETVERLHTAAVARNQDKSRRA